MKESAQAALTLVKSRAAEFGSDRNSCSRPTCMFTFPPERARRTVQRRRCEQDLPGMTHAATTERRAARSR
jgi:hypothetical protein